MVGGLCSFSIACWNIFDLVSLPLWSITRSANRRPVSQVYFFEQLFSGNYNTLCYADVLSMLDI